MNFLCVDLGNFRGQMAEFRKHSRRHRRKIKTFRLRREEQRTCLHHKKINRGKGPNFFLSSRFYSFQSFQELQSEVNALKPQYEEVLNLSNTVLMFLRECSTSSATILKEKLDQLGESYKR